MNELSMKGTSSRTSVLAVMGMGKSCRGVKGRASSISSARFEGRLAADLEEPHSNDFCSGVGGWIMISGTAFSCWYKLSVIVF